MKSILSYVIFLIFFSSVHAATPGELPIGGFLRSTTLDGLNDKTSSFEAYQGSPLIINIWASWCGPCREEMGSLQHLAQRYNGKQFNIIGISTDDYRDKAKAFIEKQKVGFDNYIDHQLELENMLGADRIPLTILVDSQGQILKKVHGAYQWDHPEVVEAIADIFKVKLD